MSRRSSLMISFLLTCSQVPMMVSGYMIPSDYHASGGSPPFVNNNGNNNSYNYNNFSQAPADSSAPVAPQPSAIYDEETSWNQYQEEQYNQRQGQYDPSNPSSIDVSKLTQFLAAGSKVSLSLIFFMLMWRSLHHYEVANSFKGMKRTMLVTPIVLLFLGDLFACVTAFTTGLDTHVAKRRAKAVLNLGKLVEAILFVYNVVKMSILPSKYIPQEIYIAGAIHNFVLITILHQYTKLSFGGLAASMESQNLKDQQYNYYGQDQYQFEGNSGNFGSYEEGVNNGNGNFSY
mmetsp:Transcript_14447/g.18883  ORF Transcript_14447/g.18883 Transcript_14447/m.18883 type:complete len:289 (-) Transcript_14447:538-1404(-)